MEKMIARRPYLRFRELKYYLGLSDEALTELLRNGEFPVLYMNGTPYIPADAFFAWLEYTNHGGAA